MILLPFGGDIHRIQFANFIVFDARERREIGIGIEMAVSRVFGTPLIVVAPTDTYYRKSKVDYRGSSVEDYIHLHLYRSADGIVDNFCAAEVLIYSHL